MGTSFYTRARDNHYRVMAFIALAALAVAPLLAFGVPAEGGSDAEPLRGEERTRSERRQRVKDVEALSRKPLAGKERSGAVSRLAGELKDPDPRVRGAAAEGLGRLKDPASYGHLMEALKSKDVDTRRGAVDGLAELGDRRAVPELAKLAGDGDENTRWKTAIALGRLKDPRGVPALLKALDDPSLYVCYAAADSLGAIGDRRAAAALKAKASDQDPGMKARAAKALQGLEKGAGKKR